MRIEFTPTSRDAIEPTSLARYPRGQAMAEMSERVLRAVSARLGAWVTHARARRELAGLPEHQLRDIGLSRAELFAESRKVIFW